MNQESMPALQDLPTGTALHSNEILFLEQHMKTTQLITAAIALAISGSALAQGAVTAPTPASTSAAVAMQAGTVTRAQVVAELYRARANGEIPVTEADYGKLPAAGPSNVTREQVRAELERAQKNGEIPRTQADYGRIPAYTGTSTMTRAQVAAELAQAQKHGQIRTTEADYDVAKTKSHVAM
jgi:hypothetical protein